MAFGVSFVPGQDQQGQPQQPGGPSANDRYQQAIQFLSLRLPKVLGGSAFAPAPLLTGTGAQGSPFGRSAALQTQQGQPQQNPLMMILQAFGLGGLGAPNAAPMSPHFTPGTGPVPEASGSQLPQTIARPPATGPIISPAGPGWNPEYYPSGSGSFSRSINLDQLPTKSDWSGY